MSTNPLLNACRYLLEPIARLMISNGVQWADFAEATKQAFVKVARGDYGLQGRPTNTSRVAILTGLSRREVARVKDVLTGKADAEPPPASRISQVLTGWHVDTEFLAEGRPAELPLDGDEGSFAALLKRYAGDMPHGAVTKEMERLGLIVRNERGFRVTARDYIRSAADPDMLRQASVALHDHADTVVHNVDTRRTEPARFERMATRTDVPADVAAEFGDFVADRAQALLEEIDAWLETRTAAAKTGTVRQRTVRTGLGIYLIHDRLREPRDDDQ